MFINEIYDESNTNVLSKRTQQTPLVFEYRNKVNNGCPRNGEEISIESDEYWDV